MAEHDLAGPEVSGPDLAGPVASVATGNPQVDEVLQSLEELSDLPVDQHVAVFEAAHTRLREALSEAGSPAAVHG